jgi:hypothetical protein
MRRLLCTVFVALLSWPVSGHSEHKAAALPSASKASIAEYFATTKPITVSGIVHSLAWQTKFSLRIHCNRRRRAQCAFSGAV